MPLLETLAFTLGPAIAKYVVKEWLGDGLKLEIAKALVDLVKGEGQNALMKYREGRDIETLGQRIVQKMTPLFEQEARSLDKDARNVTAYAFALTLAEAHITPQQLVEFRLAPEKLARSIGRGGPTRRMGFRKTRWRSITA